MLNSASVDLYFAELCSKGQQIKKGIKFEKDDLNALLEKAIQLTAYYTAQESTLFHEYQDKLENDSRFRQIKVDLQFINSSKNIVLEALN